MSRRCLTASCQGAGGHNAPHPGGALRCRPGEGRQGTAGVRAAERWWVGGGPGGAGPSRVRTGGASHSAPR
ncbi:hypothetical protein SSCG_00641 [Streptomyces clavuligerus]|nr:hypothetical protein SSCG_00641 [Streptomyces clavuligerus]